MKNDIIGLALVCIIVFIMAQVIWIGCDRVFVGKFLTDKNHYEFLNSLLRTGKIEYGEIKCDSGFTIKKSFPADLLTTYYIEDFGQIMIGSKMSKRISEWKDSADIVRMNQIIKP